MEFASIRIITADVDRLAAFYELVTGVAASRPAPVFAELRTAAATLAIGSTATVAMLGAAAPAPLREHSSLSADRGDDPLDRHPSAIRASPVIIEFLVDDVDAQFARLRPSLVDADVVLEPTTMPWGNRSTLIRDPDGNLVNLFTRPQSA